jgi:hypothetical protein
VGRSCAFGRVFGIGDNPVVADPSEDERKKKAPHWLAQFGPGPDGER